MSYQDFPPQKAAPSITGPYTLTRDEQRVLRECAQESFYRRCIPFMTALGLGAYYGVHLGYLKPNLNYGSVPKVATGLFIGFIAGKLSYKSQCEEKILRLPGGRLKESVLFSRQSKDNVWGSFEDKGLYKEATLSYALPSYSNNDFYSYQEPVLNSELDVERPIDSFDDSFKLRSSYSDEIDRALPNAPPSPPVSYDELRNKNRDEYDSRKKQYRSTPIDDYRPFSEPYPSSQTTQKLEPEDRLHKPSYHSADPYYTPSQTRNSPQRRNYYGDIIDK